MVHSNQACVGDENIEVEDPCSVEICEFQKCNLGFSNMNYFSHDCADEISEKDNKRSNFDQSEV